MYEFRTPIDMDSLDRVIGVYENRVSAYCYFVRLTYCGCQSTEFGVILMHGLRSHRRDSAPLPPGR